MTVAPETKLSRTQALLLKAEASAKETTVKDIERVLENHQGSLVPGTAGVVETKQMPRVVMFKPISTDHPGERRAVPSTNCTALVNVGWTFECPHCGSADCLGAPLRCPAIPSPAWGRCPHPACSKVLFDPIGEGATLRPEAETDPALDGDKELKFEVTYTARQRVNDLIGAHVWAKHEHEAVSLGYGAYAPRAEGRTMQTPVNPQTLERQVV